MSSAAPTVRLIFTDADQKQPDPAAVSAIAYATVSSLLATGEQVTAAYTGEKSASEVFLWFIAASATANALIALPDFALKVAQLLSEIKKLRGDEPPPSAAQESITLIIHVNNAMATLHSNTTPADIALLTSLLSKQLPNQINLADVTAEVRVPSTPPNEL